jgi:hypothetical protein
MAPARQGSSARSAALIALATLAVHQLRYLLAYGSGAHAEMARQGHAYLFGALPVLVAFAVATLAAGLLRAAVGAAPGRTAIAPPRSRALLYGFSIAAAFAVQESTEGLLFAGHASGLAAVFGGGGWTALPLALVFGGLCALLDGGLARLESLVAPATPAAVLPRAPRLRGAPVAQASPSLTSSPLAFGLARRPPPPVRCPGAA